MEQHKRRLLELERRALAAQRELDAIEAEDRRLADLLGTVTIPPVPWIPGPGTTGTQCVGPFYVKTIWDPETLPPDFGTFQNDLSRVRWVPQIVILDGDGVSAWIGREDAFNVFEMADSNHMRFKPHPGYVPPVSGGAPGGIGDPEPEPTSPASIVLYGARVQPRGDYLGESSSYIIYADGTDLADLITVFPRGLTDPDTSSGSKTFTNVRFWRFPTGIAGGPAGEFARGDVVVEWPVAYPNTAIEARIDPDATIPASIWGAGYPDALRTEFEDLFAGMKSWRPTTGNVKSLYQGPGVMVHSMEMKNGGNLYAEGSAVGYPKTLRLSVGWANSFDEEYGHFAHKGENFPANVGRGFGYYELGVGTGPPHGPTATAVYDPTFTDWNRTFGSAVHFRWGYTRIENLPGVQGVYRSDYGTTLSGANVTTWAPLAGSVGTVFADTGFLPTFQAGSGAGGIGGYPTIRVGLNAYHRESAQNYLRAATGATLIAVWRHEAQNNSGALVGGAAISNGFVSLGHKWPSPDVSFRAAAFEYRKTTGDALTLISGPTLTVGQVYYMIGRVNFAAGSEFAELRVNGMKYAGAAPTSGAFANVATRVLIGYKDWFTTGFQTLNGSIAEVAIIGRCLTDDEADIQQELIRERYGLT